MASFSAQLRVAGHVFPVLHCSYHTSQATNERGRVSAKVRHHPVELVLDVPDSDVLLAWAADPHKRQAADIVFLDPATGSAIETLHLAAAYCVSYRENFAVGDTSTGAYQCHLTLSDPDGFTLLQGGPVGKFTTPPAGNHGLPAAANIAAAPIGNAGIGGAVNSVAWNLDKVSKLDEVAKHRLQEGLPIFAHSPGTTGTVAHTQIKEIAHYGYNSKIDDFNPRLDGKKRYTLGLEERREWFNRLKKKGQLSDLSDLSRAQFLSHAEAEALIKAAKNGKLPKVVDMYVDRATCPNCRKYLPALLGELGVDTLNIFYKIKDHPGFNHLPINGL